MANPRIERLSVEGDAVAVERLQAGKGADVARCGIFRAADLRRLASGATVKGIARLGRLSFQSRILERVW
jgi:hypothetical protein